MIILANKIIEYSEQEWNELDKSKIDSDYWRLLINTNLYVKTSTKEIVENAKLIEKLEKKREQKYQEYLKLKQEFENE